MEGRVKRAILSGGMLVCFFGMVYSYSIGYDLGIIANAGIFFVILIRWMKLQE